MWTYLGDPLADEILNVLKRTPDGLTRTDIRDVFGRNRRAGEIERALGILLKAGLARKVTEKAHTEDGEAVKGRPIERWFACTTKTTKTT